MKNNVKKINELLDAEFNLLRENGKKNVYKQIRLEDFRTILDDIYSLIQTIYLLKYR